MRLSGFVLFFSTAFFFLSASACPLGANENHLTIQRVMLNFGKYVSAADAIAVRSRNPHETISNSEISSAVEKLHLALSCANAVIQNPTGDVLPSKYYFLPEESEKKSYVEDFVDFMTDFRDSLKNYQDSLKQILEQKPEERKFQNVIDKMNAVDQQVDRAHRKLIDYN